MGNDFNLSLSPFLQMAGPSSPISGLGTPQLNKGMDINKMTPANSGGWGSNPNPTIFGGMPVGTFTSIMGLLGQAMGGDTPGGKISQVAAALGQTQIKALAAQNQQKQQQQFLKELLGKGGDLENITPEQAKVLGITPNLLLGSSPSGATGLETGNITPAKLGELNKPSLF